MSKLKKFNIKENFSRKLKLVRVLEEFEFPILLEYHSVLGSSYYLEKLCIVVDGIYRFMFVRTEGRAIAEYLAKKISMKNLLTSYSDGGCYIVDKDENGNIIESHVVRFSELPPEYMPTEDSFHDYEYRPDWEKTAQSFLIESEWNGKLFAKLERYYLSVSSLVYFAAKGQGRRLPGTVFNLKYDGGFPVMHMYNEILASTPVDKRAKCIGVSAASPGVLTINSSTENVENLRKSIEALESAKEIYKKLHEWSKLKPSELDSLTNADQAMDDLTDMCNCLNIDLDALFPESSKTLKFPKKHKPNILTAGKIIAAFYRSLEKILKVDEEYRFIG